jgi:hypothetical protein
MVPLWLDEGIAEYFEVPAEERTFDHPHFRSLRWNMRLGMIRTVDDLEQRHDLEEMSAGDYRFSWAWTHFMLHGPQVAYNELIGFFSDIRRGTPPGQLSARLARAVPDVNDRLIDHFKHWQRPPAAVS